MTARPIAAAVVSAVARTVTALKKKPKKGRR
jgi:hypothetical protein